MIDPNDAPVTVLLSPRLIPLGPMLIMRDNCEPSDSVDIDGADCPLFVIYGAREIMEGVAA